MAKKKDTPNDLPNTAQKTKDWAQKKSVFEFRM